MSHFAFLQAEWPEIHEAAEKAESFVRTDPRASCFYARRSLELAVHWLYKHDPALRLPYRDNLSALIHEPSFRNTCGDAVYYKARLIIELGNEAVHTRKPMVESDALIAARELFHVAYWVARTYARNAQPAPGLVFDPERLPYEALTSPHTLEQLQQLQDELEQRDQTLSEMLADKSKLDEELKRLRAEIATIKQANASVPDTHDYSEAETRDYFIDLLLKEAGWALDRERDREYKVTGLPTDSGVGYADYVLWGDNGKPLAVVEAKRTRRDPLAGQQQAKLYADALEQEFGQRPVIFCSNGYEHWIWDDVRYPKRRIQGFYKKDELQLLIQRRNTRKPLSECAINTAIVERPYQHRAIRRVCETFELDLRRKALLVMATGTGKTRTAVALADLLTRCNWAKRVLFLADRTLLVDQALKAFKKHLPDSSPVNLLEEKGTEGRVFISTYPTMMNLIEQQRSGERRFGVGHFDLIIIDEAHRSVFQKFRAIFEYFDTLLLGLTATPKDEVDRNTYSLFELENGVPTDAYPLEDAVRDHFLVPFQAVSVPLKYQREGIRYEDLTEEEKDQWDALEWDEEGGVPERVEAAAVNQWLFNKNTVDRVLRHLMERGLKVAGGDRLGKTIIFARNHPHAKFIAERFDANYPQYKSQFAQVIDYHNDRSRWLKEDFENPEKAPHIAISVDMLDTGIDVPAVVNLVFFKLVRSKTKFWQMVGRGTRLCTDLFGPGKDKRFFYIFDYCQNLEFFSQDPPTTEGNVTAPLDQRLFQARVALIHALDQHKEATGEAAHESPRSYLDAPDGTTVREDTADLLRTHVAAMNLENFIVRPKRRLVERFREPEVWAILTHESLAELTNEVSGLPSALPPEPEEAKRFDLLLLRLQLAVLQSEPGFERMRDRVREIVTLLEEKAAIPLIRDQLELLHELQSDEWWQDVTVPMLEHVRRRVRGLVHLIEKRSRKPVYTDFEDEMGPETLITLPATDSGTDLERFRAKVRQFLEAHKDHLTLHKVRRNQPLTAADLAELERMLLDAGVGTKTDLERAKEENQGLGLFIRSLVGLDREDAKREFGEFLGDRNLTSNQIEFINLIIDHLTEKGTMDPALLYGSPFVDLSPRGPEGLFTDQQVDRLISVLAAIRRRAV